MGWGMGWGMGWVPMPMAFRLKAGDIGAFWFMVPGIQQRCDLKT
jgi:hypothetical protein